MTRLLLALTLALGSPARAKVAFRQGGLDAALEEAGKTGKVVMVDVYATWCGPCHELDRTVFASAEVARVLAPRVVAVKIDGEKEPEGPRVMDRYHVVGFPTVLFLSADGVEIDRIFDVPEPKEFVRIALGYVEGKGTLVDREKDWARAPSPELAYELGFRHAVKGHEAQAKSYFAALALYGAHGPAAVATAQRLAARIGAAGRVTRGDGKPFELSLEPSAQTAEQVKKLLPSAFFDLGKWLYLRGLKDYKAAEHALEEVIALFPGTREADAAQLQLAYAFHGQGDHPRTRAQLEKYLSAQKRSASAVNAVAWFCFKKGFEQSWAIGLAEEALAKEPKEAGLWDTLAELYAAVGRPGDAVVASSKAREHDPEEPYYEEQRAKFQALARSMKAK